jgi:hypothetical protein
MRSTATAQASGAARRASDSPVARALARAGLVVRGVIYILIGWMAILVALGQTSQHADQQGALQLLASKPYGLVLLWLLGIGFAGYALWRLSEAAFGVPGEGNGTGPRLKSLVRALIYAGFACLTFDCAPATMLSRVSPGRRWIPCLSPVVLCRGGREACRTMTSTLSVIPAYAGCPSWRGQVAEEVRPSG